MFIYFFIATKMNIFSKSVIIYEFWVNNNQEIDLQFSKQICFRKFHYFYFSH